MTSHEDFDAAAMRVKGLTTRPSNGDLLELYALYKQGSVGDVQGKRPGMMKFTERAKFDAWATKKGTAKDAAQKQYVELVDGLLQSNG